MMAKKATAAERSYMSKVASMPCALGVALDEDHGPVNVHHIREGHGMAQRASNFLVIPLCWQCHQGPHGIHGDRALLRIAKVEELDLLAATIEMVFCK